jgi:cell division protein FtsL
MNLIGKILVGVIFVLSIVFMTLGITFYQTQTNWRDKTKKIEDEKGKVSARNTQLESEIAKLKDEFARLEDELKEDKVKLEAKNVELKEANDTLENLVSKVSQENDNSIKLLASIQKNMSDLREELLVTRSKLAIAQSELHKQFEQMVAETNTARTLAMQLATLKSTYDGLYKEWGDARYLLTQLGYGDLAPAIYDKHLLDVPPRVAGTITDINSNGLLEINIGRDDGLLKGHKLHVYRDRGGVESYLGKIEIIDVKPGKSVGRIMPEFREGTILRDDKVKAYISQITASL